MGGNNQGIIIPLNSTQKQTLSKLNGLEATAGEIDRATTRTNKPSDYIVPIRSFTSLDGVTLTTNGGGLATITLDGATLDDGKPVLKIHSNNATTMIRVLVDIAGFGDSILATERKDIGIQVKISNAAGKLSYVNVFLASSSNLANHYVHNQGIQGAYISADGMFYVPFYHKEFNVGGGSPQTLPMKYIRFDILPLAGNSSGAGFEIEIIKVVKFKRRKSRCMISFDDGHASCMSIADLLDARGLKSTFYVVSDWINTSGALTLTQTLDLHNRGHDIAVHSKTHDTAVSVGDATYFNNQQVCRDWVRENVSPRAADHAAFIGGSSTDTLIAMMQRAGFKSTRKATPALYGYLNAGFGTGNDNLWRSPRWKGNTWGMDNTTTVATMISMHQDAINSNQDFFVYGHQLQYDEGSVAWSSTAGDPYSMADYLDWLASKVASGEVEVLTVSQFWDGI